MPAAIVLRPPSVPASLALTTSSTSLTNLSVSFWMSSSPRRASSSVICFSFSSSLTLMDGVAADVADRHLGVLAFGVHVLGQFLAALFGQRRQVDADDRCRRCSGFRPRSEARIAFSTAATIGFSHGRDGQRARVGDGHGGDLRQRHVGTVVVHLQVIDQRRGGAAGAHLGQVVANASTLLVMRVWASFLMSFSMAGSAWVGNVGDYSHRGAGKSRGAMRRLNDAARDRPDHARSPARVRSAGSRD